MQSSYQNQIFSTNLINTFAYPSLVEMKDHYQILRSCVVCEIRTLGLLANPGLQMCKALLVARLIIKKVDRWLINFLKCGYSRRIVPRDKVK